MGLAFGRHSVVIKWPDLFVINIVHGSFFCKITDKNIRANMSITVISGSMFFFLREHRLKCENKWIATPQHRSVRLRRKSTFGLAVTLTFDLWPWKPFHRRPPTSHVMVTRARFTSNPSLNEEISARYTQKMALISSPISCLELR